MGCVTVSDKPVVMMKRLSLDIIQLCATSEHGTIPMAMVVEGLHFVFDIACSCFSILGTILKEILY